MRNARASRRAPPFIVLDLATLVALVLGGVAAARQRYAFGVVVALVVAVALCVAPLVPRADRVSGEYAATLLFIGPSALMPAILTRELFAIAVTAAAFYGAARRAGQLRPELAEARAWDATSRPFLAAAVIRSVIAVASASIEILLTRMRI